MLQEQVRYRFARLRMRVRGWWWRYRRSEHHLDLGQLVACAVLVGIAVAAFVQFISPDEGLRQYSQTYSFIPEKISKSAPIVIYLPEGIDKYAATTSISFEPQIAGTWVAAQEESVVVYQPNDPLDVGLHYAVHLNAPAVQISDDFLADEDPRVEAVFPRTDSEVNEDSKITIVFNRPMVPLTTLATLEKDELPISIEPETPGRFKWVSTRNLQFIPDERLRRSSQYRVEIGDGLTSVEGLSVPPQEHTFTTRPLRYTNFYSGELRYDQPITLYFNQPVDVEASRDFIEVANKQSGVNVPIRVEYGTRTVYNDEDEEYETFTDRSILAVYQRSDRFGRRDRWDFGESYTLTMRSAVPLEGDILLESRKSTEVAVTEVIVDMSARSDRSEHVRPDLFDPAGTLSVTFAEEVDLRRTQINAKGLESVRYARACRVDEEGNIVLKADGQCEQEDVKHILQLTFDATELQKDERIPITFTRVVNSEGVTITGAPIEKAVTTFPAFQLLNTIPADGSSEASLTELTLCSNTPIAPRTDETYQEALSATQFFTFNRWSSANYVARARRYNECPTGTFETTIRYGLHPETEYTLSLSLSDEFGQTLTEEMSFTTTAPDEVYTRFHNMQKQYNVTPPERTRLTYAVENLEFMDLHICKLSAEAFLRELHDQPDAQDPPRTARCAAVTTDRVSLPKRYWVNNYFQIDLADYFNDTRGHYILTFSNPNHRYSRNDGMRRERTYVSVTNLAVGEKRVNWDPYREVRSVEESIVGQHQNLYWVNRYKTLSPVPDATVTLFRERDDATLEQGATYTTDVQGIARGETQSHVRGAVVRAGEDTAVISDWVDQLRYVGAADETERTYLYTDRPIYRPGQKVHIKGISRIGYDGAYEIVPERSPTITIIDSKGSTLYEQDVSQTRYGTFSADITLPQDAPLGTYYIEAFDTRTPFDVEAYVPSPFKLELTSSEDEYIAGDMLDVRVDADYFFGVPVESGEVEYAISSQDYFFDRYNEGGFDFGNPWYFCYRCGYNDRFLMRGTTQLNAAGEAHIEEAINFARWFDEPEEEKSKLFVVDVTVKDPNGRSVSAQHSVIVHRGELYVGSRAEPRFTGVQEPIEVRLKTVDTEGSEVSHDDIELSVARIEWKNFKRREVDGFYYRSERVEVPIASRTVETDGNGSARELFSFEQEGRYEITARTQDDRGNPIRSKTTVYIYGDGQVSVPQTSSHALELEADALKVGVGDRPTVVVQSPYQRAKALITVDRGHVFDYWVRDVDQNLFHHVIPIKSAYSPNVYASVMLLSSDPEIKYGDLEFMVAQDERELTVVTRPDKTEYLPGEDVELSITTTDNRGRPTPAEVSIAVADLSVLALKGNPKKNPLRYFYNGFPLTVLTASNIKNILHEVDIPLGTKGGGGTSPEDLERRKRGLFRDTAHWQAHVETNERGRAQVTFTLPDNLTTWQIETVGVSADETLVGTDYDEIVTRKLVMATPLKPRFVVPGDTLSLGASVFNQTDSRQRFVVALTSETLALPEKTQRSITLSPGERETVYFDGVEAPAGVPRGEHRFVFSARNEDYEDTVEQSISITPNTTYETTATAHFTKDDQATEYLLVPENVLPDRGGLTVNTNATLAVFLSDALNYMVSFPYGCSEQLASKLQALAVVKRGLDIENVGKHFTLDPVVFRGDTYSMDEVVRLGTARLYENQRQDGGFSYYPTLSSNFYLTIQVVQALHALREAGYTVSDSSIDRAARFLVQELLHDYRYSESNTAAIVLAAALADVPEVSEEERAQLAKRIEDIVADEAYLNEKSTSIELAHLAVLTADDDYAPRTRQRVFETLESRIVVDGRGAHLGDASDRRLWQFYDTPVKNTALLVKAFAVHEREHPLMDNVLRWLLKSRDKEGAWGSTNNTLAAIDALTEFLLWQRETEADFSLSVALGGRQLFTADFSDENILETQTHFVPINALPRNTITPLVFDRTLHAEPQTNFYYDMDLTYYLPADELPPRDEGLTITRALYARDDTEYVEPLSEARVGDVLRGRMVITVPAARQFVAIEDIIPAGFELINIDLATEDQTLASSPAPHSVYASGVEVMQQTAVAHTGLSGLWASLVKFLPFLDNVSQLAQPPPPPPPPLSSFIFDRGTRSASSRTTAQATRYVSDLEPAAHDLQPDFKELHDDRLFLFAEELAPGVYVYEYFVRALVPGEFQHLPARASQLYFPEVFGRTQGNIFTIEKD